MFNPGFPSKSFDSFFTSHLLEESPINEKDVFPIRRLIIAITKRCPLSCEHCSEADTLYQKDVLSVNEFKTRIDKYTNNGLGQIIYSGGEPLSRLDDLLTLLSTYNNRLDQWVYTSGFGLTPEMAKKLKEAGLNGAAISLDHYNEDAHNIFRGNRKSYYWVVEAIKNLQAEGVLVAINVCPTRQLVESGGAEKMVALANELNVPMVNFLEPRAVGNYQNKNVEYEKMHFDTLLNLSHNYNFDRSNFKYPTVLFPAGYRGKVPCGGGKSYMFLDYDGTLYPCPFCKVKMPEVRTKQEELCEAS